MVRAAITATRANIATVINTQPINHIALRELLQKKTHDQERIRYPYLTVTGVAGRFIVAQILGEIIPSFPSD